MKRNEIQYFLYELNALLLALDILLSQKEVVLKVNVLIDGMLSSMLSMYSVTHLKVGNHPNIHLILPI